MSFDISTGTDLVWGVLSTVAVLVFARIALHSPWPRARRISWSLALAFVGPACNKLYWAVAAMTSPKPRGFGGWGVEWDWLLVFPFALAIFGVLNTIREVGEARLDGHYWPVAAVSVVAVFILGGAL